MHRVRVLLAALLLLIPALVPAQTRISSPGGIGGGGGGGFVSSLTGTANQVIVSSPTGAVTLSTPQNIATTSSPTFSALTLTKTTAGTTLTVPSGTALTGDRSILFPYTAGGTITAFEIQSSDAAKGPFSLVVGDTLFSGTQDNVMYLGYNVGAGGGLKLAGQPSFRFAIEADYNTGSQHVLEAYLEYYSAAGVRYRPLFLIIDRATDALNFQFHADELNFLRLMSDVAWGKFTPTLFQILGEPTQAGNTAFSLQAQNGKFVDFSMGNNTGHNFAITTVSANLFAVRIGGTDVLRLSNGKVSIGDLTPFGAQLSVMQDSFAVATGSETIRVQVAAGSASDLLRFRDVNGVDMARVSSTGGFAGRSIRNSKTADFTIPTSHVLSGYQFDNIGAAATVIFSIPTPVVGEKYGFCVKAAQVLRVQAPASVTISLGTSTSAAAGKIEASAPYSCVDLEAMSTTEWVGTSVTGSWTVTWLWPAPARWWDGPANQMEMAA